MSRTNGHAVANCHVVVLEVPDEATKEAANHHKVTLEDSETESQPKSQM